MHKHRGFTLVETVMVIVIAGLLAVYALPRFFNQGNFDNRGFYTELLSAVRYTQQLAVAINCNTQIAITPGGYEVTIDDDPISCDGMSITTLAPDPVTRELGFTRTASVPIDNTETLVFTPLGHLLTGTADTTITTGGYSFKVISTTGYIEELQ